MTYGKQSPLENHRRQTKYLLMYYRAAFCSLRRHTDLNGLKPSLACKILDSMISPILTYNSEVWSAFVKSDFKSWKISTWKPIYNSVNALHTGNASNTACRAELGKFPKIIDINKKILNYNWLPITRTLANSNLALTRSKIDFPWISVIHLL